MEALAIVTLTLLGFAALLFGSDSLDRRLSLRASRLLAQSVPDGRRALPAPAQPVAGAADAAVIEVTALVEDEVLAVNALPEPAAA
jgi:hypothetical protein